MAVDLTVGDEQCFCCRVRLRKGEVALVRAMMDGELVVAVVVCAGCALYLANRGQEECLVNGGKWRLETKGGG